MRPHLCTWRIKMVGMIDRLESVWFVQIIHDALPRLDGHMGFRISSGICGMDASFTGTTSARSN